MEEGIMDNEIVGKIVELNDFKLSKLPHDLLLEKAIEDIVNHVTAQTLLIKNIEKRLQSLENRLFYNR
jgi:hypothetical protein